MFGFCILYLVFSVFPTFKLGSLNVSVMCIILAGGIIWMLLLFQYWVCYEAYVISWINAAHYLINSICKCAPSVIECIRAPAIIKLYAKNKNNKKQGWNAHPMQISYDMENHIGMCYAICLHAPHKSWWRSFMCYAIWKQLVEATRAIQLQRFRF